ncbi:MAG: DUF2851 family protein [Elusimicrobiota bacterium]
MLLWEEKIIGDSELLTGVYFALRKKYGLLLREQQCLPTKIVLTEKQLRTIWYDQAYDRRGMRTVDDKKVVILSPGVWNLDPGPDFINAKIRVNHRVIEGDIELHLRNTDWYAHKHQLDKRYDNVVLHVCFHSIAKKRFIRKGMHELELGKYMYAQSYALPESGVEGYPFTSESITGKCGKAVIAENLIRVENIILAAGEARFVIKAETYESILKEKRSIDEVMHYGILECLGYKDNKEAMRSLAKKVTHMQINAVIAGSEAGSDNKSDNVEKLLLTSAGLMGNIGGNTGKQSVSWVFNNLRPVNYPQRRLAGYAAMVTKLAPRSVTDCIDMIVEQSIKNNLLPELALEELVRIIVQPARGYFAERCVYGGREAFPKYAFIGRNRAMVVLSNSVLPVMYVYYKSRGKDLSAKYVRRLYRAVPCLELNRRAKLMSCRIFGPVRLKNYHIKSELQQQGLVQLFHDFCDEKCMRCVSCVLPDILQIPTAELQNMVKYLVQVQ